MNHSGGSNYRSSDLIEKRAIEVLSLNDMGEFTKPSPKLYPHQWNWDSAFIAMGLVQYQPERAKTEILSLLRGQWQDGMLPHIVFTPNEQGYFPGSDQWQSWRTANAPGGVFTSGITQPPMITIAAYEVAKRVEDSFAQLVYPPLLAFHQWLHTMRDPHNSGIVSIVHPWESGLDNSPRWIEPLSRIRIKKPLTYERLDKEHVSEQERPSKADYDRFVYLMEFTRDLNYDQTKLLTQSPFLVQDVIFNSILYRANECLRKLANIVNEPVEQIDGWLGASKKAFQTRFWNEFSGQYFDYDLRQETNIHQNTIATLIPLYAGLPSERQARFLVEKHLLNRGEFAPDAKQTNFYVPTTGKDNQYYNPQNYWRGPIWINTNWLVIEGLLRYDGYHDLAHRIRSDTLRLLGQSGFYEYFNPDDGRGMGTDNFSWSAALALALLNKEKLGSRMRRREYE
jgi:glycogen debranching enzyme